MTADPVLAELEMLLGCEARRDAARRVIVLTFRQGVYCVRMLCEPCGLSATSAWARTALAVRVLCDVAAAFDSVPQ